MGARKKRTSLSQVRDTGDAPVPPERRQKTKGGTGVSPVILRPPDQLVMIGRRSQKPIAKPRGTGVPPVSSKLRVTRRNLPHWQLGGATYFLTFRVKNGILSEEERRLVLSACLHWHQRKWRMYAAVVMPDHVHLLAQPLPCGEDEWHPLGEILHSVKSCSTHQVNRRRRTTGGIWLDESFDRIMRNEKEFREKLCYIANNPVKAGLTRLPETYPHLFLAESEPPARRRCHKNKVEQSKGQRDTGGAPVPQRKKQDGGTTNRGTGVPPVR